MEEVQRLNLKKEHADSWTYELHRGDVYNRNPFRMQRKLIEVLCGMKGEINVIVRSLVSCQRRVPSNHTCQEDAIDDGCGEAPNH